MTLAEIRAGNSNYGPASPSDQTPPPQLPQPPQSGELSGEVSRERNSPLMSQLSDYRQNDSGLIKPPETSQDAFVESLNEFEAQRNAMMSPTCNINSCKDSRLDIYPRQPTLQPSTMQPTLQPTLQFTLQPKEQPTLEPTLEVSTNHIGLPGTSSPAPVEPLTDMTDVPAETKAGEAGETPDQSDQADFKLQTAPAAETVKSGVTMNDDIKMARPRERSSPRPASLQRDNVTSRLFREEEKPKLVPQKSLETDDPELLEIEGSSRQQGRRDSQSSIIRYRPETPRTVTPVRFTPTPKLARKVTNKAGDVKPKVSLREKVEASEDVKISPGPSRNVSDSGISVNSESSAEPDDSPGKIVAESMQKIEAQMRKILEHESKAKNNEEKERSLPPPPVQEPLVTSGYSTSSEEDLTASTDIKNAPFEVMEDFEEAPAEFDIGISSYSIAHPIENDEMEKTPVPEAVETDEPPKFPYEETPYTVSTPSGTLKYDKKNHREESRGNQQQDMFETNQPKQDFSNFQIPPQSRPQQSPNYFKPPTFVEAPFQNNFFNNNMAVPGLNNHSMMGRMRLSLLSLSSIPFILDEMFNEPFPAFPSMFDGPFNGNFPAVTSVEVSKASQPGERIIPIKVVNTKSDLQQVKTAVTGVWRCNQIIHSRATASARPEITDLETSQLRLVDMDLIDFSKIKLIYS